MAPEAMFRAPEAWFEAPEAWLEAPKVRLEGGYGSTDVRTYAQNPPILSDIAPFGAAAQKGEVKHFKTGRSYTLSAFPLPNKPLYLSLIGFSSGAVMILSQLGSRSEYCLGGLVVSTPTLTFERPEFEPCDCFMKGEVISGI